MTFRHLNIFIAVCDYGSITAASKELYIAQPSVSLAIKELEEYYGVKLFDRISRKLYLNETGKQVLKKARHISKLLESINQDVETLDTPILHIGSSVTLGVHFIPHYVKIFKDMFPKANIFVTIDSSKNIEEKLLNNKLDFAIIEGIPNSDSLISKVFMDDHLVFICGKNSPLSKKKKVSLEECIAQPFLLREKGSGTRSLIDSTLLTSNYIVEPIWESISTQALVNGVINNIGVSILPYRLVEKDLNNQKIIQIPVENINFSRSFRLIYHKDKYITKGMNDFFQLLFSNLLKNEN